MTGAREFAARAVVGAAPWVILLLIVANIAAGAWHADLLEERRNNLLTAVPETDGTPRYDLSVGEDLGRYWPAIPDGRKQPLVVLCGMSQMYAINERKPRDRTIAEWMDDALAPGTRVFGLAAPNLTNEEALLLLLSTLTDPKTKPSAFIFGVCFDKFRNIDLRDGYRRFLRGRPELAAAWSELARRYADRYPAAAEAMQASLDPKDAPPAEATAESRIRAAASRVFPLVAARQELNAFVQERAFRARNAVLHITPTSKRPILRSRYALNQQFVELMIDLARERGVVLPLYVIPLNPQAANPYVPEEYERSVRWLEGLCRDRGVPFANLEGAVPAEHWGEFMGGPDFKHFKGEGHRITATAVLHAFAPVLAAR